MATKTLSPFHSFEMFRLFFWKMDGKIKCQYNPIIIHQNHGLNTEHIFEHGDKDKNVSKNGPDCISYQSLACLKQIGKQIKGQYI